MTKDEKFDAAVDRLEERIESGVLNWVRNDQFFNGFRNTPARFVLAAISIAVLYGYGWFAFITPGAAGYLYPVFIFIVVLSQKLSVRFVFDDDSIIDEYQHKRRNKAYRRAYKRIGLILSLVIVAAALKASVGLNLTAQSNFWPLPNGELNLAFTTYQAYIALVFLLGLFTIQKYLSWGFRGESLK
jgi:hypothetical protein